MRQTHLIAIGLAVVVLGAGWFYYEAGQPTESEASLLEACLVGEDMVRLGSEMNTGLQISGTASTSTICDEHRQKLGRRKVKAITDKFRSEQAFQLKYGTPPTVGEPGVVYGPAPAAAP